MGNRGIVACKVIADDGLDILDAPNGNYEGHYNYGNIIRTIEPNSKRPADDGKVYVCYTVGGHAGKKLWVACEDENGNDTLEPLPDY